ncbi:MAG: S46 family peptidase [bacterium]
MNFNKRKDLIYFCVGIFFLIAGLSTQAQINLDTVKAQKFDTGKMWTFDDPPLEYFEETYGFEPSNEWLDHVRLSTLRYGGGCTASFISADGLIMTNNHCAEGAIERIQKDGEDIANNGFYAATLEEERRVPRLAVTQLVLIEDVTNEVQSVMESGNSNLEKAQNRDKKIEEIQNRYNTETGLECRVVTLYNGGKFSLYQYKRYRDVRLKFLPEQQSAYLGGDWDNFTYPRYNMDCAFLRVYDENGKPLNSENYLKWNVDGPSENEVVFTVGNPGRTNRLETVANLEYYRDVSYRNNAFRLDTYYDKMESLKSDYPERVLEFEEQKTNIGNSQKVYTNIYKGLMDPYLIARKADFENNLKAAVEADSDLKEKYGMVWDEIRKIRKELTPIERKIAGYTFGRLSPKYFEIANELVKIAEQKKLDEATREENYKGAKLDFLIESLFPTKFDKVIETAKLEVQLAFIKLNLGEDNELVKKLTKGMNDKDAAEYLIRKSKLTDKESVIKIAQSPTDHILNANDPFIDFILQTKDELKELQEKSKALTDEESVYKNMLGQAMFEIYGTSIPPDANGTLRISDGLLKQFEYNGTIAPVKTTFYGMYDRYYSNDGKYPWNLPAKWLNPGPEFDKSVPFNFISTNDIIGGNSGSPVINAKAEVVGLAFDGNIDSIIGNFIFMPEMNRMVGVTSNGLIEALQDIYHAKEMVDEILTGSIKN